MKRNTGRIALSYAACRSGRTCFKPIVTGSYVGKARVGYMRTVRNPRDSAEFFGGLQFLALCPPRRSIQIVHLTGQRPQQIVCETNAKRFWVLKHRRILIAPARMWSEKVRIHPERDIVCLRVSNDIIANEVIFIQDANIFRSRTRVYSWRGAILLP